MSVSLSLSFSQLLFLFSLCLCVSLAVSLSVCLSLSLSLLLSLSLSLFFSLSLLLSLFAGRLERTDLLSGPRWRLALGNEPQLWVSDKKSVMRPVLFYISDCVFPLPYQDGHHQQHIQSFSKQDLCRLRRAEHHHGTRSPRGHMAPGACI